MEFLGKDKLIVLQEERRRRRQQRAEEAVRRLDTVGKQTLQLLQEGKRRPGDAEARDAAANGSGLRPGAFTRVLLEATEPDDPRRASRRGKRAKDRGRGVDGAAAGASGGIRGMHERATLIHADLRVGPRDGGGTEVVLHVPLSPDGLWYR
jgi:hypothetical protein